MPSDHPPSPSSPSQPSFDSNDILNHKLATSPGLVNSLPTPAHSINGSMSSIADTVMTDNHTDESPNKKRKRDIEDYGDQEQKKAHIGDSGISIADLHVDVGPKYLLCKTLHPANPVPWSQDLFQLYGLDAIAATVSREKPDGSKNVIRKSYKGIMKNLKLAGAFDAQESKEPNTLFDMMRTPDDQWDADFGAAASCLSQGLPPPFFNENISGAMTMSRGALPKSAWNNKVLGTDFANIAAPGMTGDHARSAQAAGSRTPVQQANGVRTAKGDLARAKRPNAKRSYRESDYEGYAEGFNDDEMGYSTGGDGENGMGGRKRLKKFPNAQSSLNPRQSSYGPGSIGV